MNRPRRTPQHVNRIRKRLFTKVADFRADTHNGGLGTYLGVTLQRHFKADLFCVNKNFNFLKNYVHQVVTKPYTVSTKEALKYLFMPILSKAFLS